MPLACLIILRGQQCSGKTEVSQRLRETLGEKQKKQTYLLKLNEINTQRFKKALNESLDKKYKYVIGELNYGDSHSTDPRTWLQHFKDRHYQIVSFVLLEYDRIFYKKSGLREITLNTENKSPSQVANEILRSILSQ